MLIFISAPAQIVLVRQTATVTRRQNEKLRAANQFITRFDRQDFNKPALVLVGDIQELQEGFKVW